jgi:DNA-binding FrmR family transcriptional regulator
MESKFISKETLGYLNSQMGATTQQRLEALEGNVENIAKFLEEQQKFLSEYEAYLEAQIKAVEDKLDRVEGKTFNQISSASVRIDDHFSAIINSLDKRVSKISAVTLFTVVAVIALGVIACLAK